MFRNIVFVLFMAICLIGVPCGTAQADTQEERIEAAIVYEELVPIEGIMNDVLNEFKKNPAVRISAEDIELMRQSYDYDGLREQYIQMMAKHFSLAEIKALTEFYSKPEGRSVMKKMPAYMSDFMPYIQQAAMASAQEVLRRRQQ